jgi:hypothetical protein
LILGKAYDPNTIRRGWGDSGLDPFELRQIMRKFPKWTKEFTPAEHEGVLAAAEELTVESSTSGVCEDKDMVAAVREKEGCKDLADTMDDVAHTAIIRMRTVRFGGERVMELRRQEVATRIARNAQREAAAAAATRAAAGPRESAKDKKRRLTEAFNANNLPSQACTMPSQFPLRCSNNLCSSTLVSTADSIDGWIQCSIIQANGHPCGRAFCSKKSCVTTQRKNHSISCATANNM